MTTFYDAPDMRLNVEDMPEETDPSLSTWIANGLFEGVHLVLTDPFTPLPPFNEFTVDRLIAAFTARYRLLLAKDVMPQRERYELLAMYTAEMRRAQIIEERAQADLNKRLLIVVGDTMREYADEHDLCGHYESAIEDLESRMNNIVLASDARYNTVWEFIEAAQRKYNVSYQVVVNVSQQVTVTVDLEDMTKSQIDDPGDAIQEELENNHVGYDIPEGSDWEISDYWRD